MQMSVNEEAPDAKCVRLSGRLDTEGVGAIEPRFHAAVSSRGFHALIDMNDVEFVASLGIRMLVQAAKNLQRRGSQRLVLFGLQEHVEESLVSAGLDRIIPFTADAASALEAARAS